VPGDDGRAVLAVQHLAQPGDVMGQRSSTNRRPTHREQERYSAEHSYCVIPFDRHLNDDLDSRLNDDPRYLSDCSVLSGQADGSCLRRAPRVQASGSLVFGAHSCRGPFPFTTAGARFAPQRGERCNLLPGVRELAYL
jgi:hypothetical protein